MDKKPRFQFSLRRLLIIVMAAAVLLGLCVRPWYLDRLAARRSRERLKGVRVFLSKEFTRLNGEKKQQTGVELDFDDYSGIVGQGNYNFDWDLQFQCGHYVNEQHITYVDLKIAYRHDDGEGGTMEIKPVSSAGENAAFEERAGKFLSAQGWRYEVKQSSAK